jgi:uncharacterized protein YdbL (DUF1318 family)
VKSVLRSILVVGGVGLLVGCATVRLDTPEPLKVDINMKVDVEQKGGTAGKVEMTTLSAGEERRMLSHQVQELKNDHKVGEGRDGLLVLKEMPKDQAYIDYAKTVVAKENGAREKLFAEKAVIEKKSEAQYAKEFAQRVRQASYPGEWIQEDDGKWKKR